MIYKTIFISSKIESEKKELYVFIPPSPEWK